MIGPGVKTGVRLRVDNPSEVGADRIANTLAAHRRYGGPAIVVDFGTTTNFDVVSAAEPQANAAELRLVWDLRRERLHRDRTVDGLRERSRRRRGATS